MTPEEERLLKTAGLSSRSPEYANQLRQQAFALAFMRLVDVLERAFPPPSESVTQEESQ